MDVLVLEAASTGRHLQYQRGRGVIQMAHSRYKQPLYSRKKTDT
jgi:hypothetical protein